MKLFWGSIVFISLVGFTPLAYGQGTTTYIGNGINGANVNNFTPVTTGAFNVPSNWNNGVPNGIAGGTTGIFQVNTYLYSSNFNNTVLSNDTLTVTVPAGQSAQGLQFQGGGTSNLYSGSGTINLQIATGTQFVITGISPPLNNSITVETSVTTNISGGNLSIQAGNTVVGDINGYSDNLNFSNTVVNYGNNIIMAVGSGLVVNSILTGGEVGSVTQNQASILTGTNFALQIGANTGSSGSYSMQNGSKLTLGDSSVIVLGSTGVLNVDGSSSITMGSGSIFVGQTTGDNTAFNLAGTLNGAGLNVVVGGGGSTGFFGQSGGNIAGTVGLTLGGAAGGNGTFNKSGGNGTLLLGLFVGNGGGTGTVNQSGGTLTIGPANVALIGGGGGQGTYNLSGGSVDFQGGVTVGSLGILSQSAGGALSVEGVATIAAGGSYTMAGTNATFNGTLVDNGILNLNGGTLQISESNLSGTGLFNFGGGTLKLTTGATPTPTFNFGGNITGGVSTIDTSASNITSFTFANPLTQAVGTSGGMSFVGNGTTQFNFASGGTAANNNFYTGPTSITAGTLVANQNDIAPSQGLNLGAGGTLKLNLNGAGFAYTNNISGPGKLDLNFAAANEAFVITSSNNFTGSIVIGANGTQGQLQVYNGTFNSITEGAAGGAVVIGGPSLVGAIAVPTSGTVLLPGLNAYTGLTTINSGFTVKASNFTGNVTNAGSLGTLGNFLSPAQMNIGGSLNSNGTILVGTNGTIADKFVVGNNGNTTTTTLSGVVKTVGVGTGTYPVVETGGAGLLVIGGNGNLNDPNGLNTNAPLTLFSSTLSLSATGTLYVNTVQLPLIGFAQTPAQRAVANTLDPISQHPPLALVPLLFVLNNIPASELPVALTQLSPQALQAAPGIAFENSTFLVQRLNGALADMRSGYTGLDASGVSFAQPGFDKGLGRSLSSLFAANSPSFHSTAPNGVNYYPDDGTSPTPPTSADIAPTPPSRMSHSDASSPTTYNNQVMSDSPVPMRTSTPPTLRTSRFSEFVAGDVVLADMDANANNPSKTSYTAGDIMAGVAYRMTSNLSVGVLFDYNHTDAKTDAYGSKTNVNSFTPGIFATFFEKDFYANGLFAFGFNQYNNNRQITALGPLNGTATSDPTGQQYSVNLDLGYDFHPTKQWTFGPIGGITYSHLYIDKFTESGVPAANLTMNSQSADSLRTRLGGHVEYLTKVGNIVLQPNLTGMWQHEYITDNPNFTGNYQLYSSPVPLTLPYAQGASDSALLGCGLTATLDSSMAFYLNYLADVGGDGFLAQSIIAGVKGSF